MYKDLSSKKKSKNKDIFAENSNKLNQINDQILHDNLFNLQESRKRGKKEVKNSLPEFQTGGINYYTYNGKQYQEGDTVTMNGIPYQVRRNSLFGYPLTIERINTKTTTGDTPAPSYSISDEPLTIYSPDPLTIYAPAEQTKLEASKKKTVAPKRRTSGRQLTNQLGLSVTPTVDGKIIDRTRSTVTPTEVQTTVGNQYLGQPSTYTYTPRTSSTSGSRNFSIPNILGDLGNSLLELFPAFSNLADRPELFATQLNPYRDQINRTMTGRRYNINPALREIERNRAVANYNANQLSPNTGAGMAFRLQNAVNTNRAISDLYTQKNNIDNQYLADYANALNNLGQQYVTAQNLAVDQNARSRAASRNINRAGLSQLSQWTQRNRLMSNQVNRDNAMLGLFGPFMNQGYTQEQWNKYLRQVGG